MDALFQNYARGPYYSMGSSEGLSFHQHLHFPGEWMVTPALAPAVKDGYPGQRI